MLAGGFLIIGPSLRRAVSSASFDKYDLFSCRFATCHLHYFALSSIEMSLPVTLPSPESPPFTSHYEMLLYLDALCFRTPSGVFTMTCIISLCAWGVSSKPAWPRDHSTGSRVKGGGRSSQVQRRKSNQIRQNLFSNHHERVEHLLYPPPWYLQNLALMLLCSWSVSNGIFQNDKKFLRTSIMQHSSMIKT